MRLARAGARVTVVDAAVPGCGANRHNLAPVARDVIDGANALGYFAVPSAPSTAKPTATSQASTVANDRAAPAAPTQHK